MIAVCALEAGIRIGWLRGFWVIMVDSNVDDARVVSGYATRGHRGE